MNTQIIEEAINSSLSLLYNELDNIEYEELKNEYKVVINKLETAKKEIVNKE